MMGYRTLIFSRRHLILMTLAFLASGNNSLLIGATIPADESKESVRANRSKYLDENSERVIPKGRKATRNLPQQRPKLPIAKKKTCSGRKCELDLSLIDPDATEIVVEVGLNETHLKTFKSTGKRTKKGHMNAETGYSYLNLIKQGSGPSGMDFWFGNIYDGENDVFYDISPNSNGSKIITNAKLRSERPLPHGIPVSVAGDNGVSAKKSSTIVSDSHRQLVDDGSVIDVMFVWTQGAECKVSGQNPGCTLTSQTQANIRGKLDATIAGTNAIYLNSGIQTKLNLVFAYRHPTYTWDYQNACDQALDHLTYTNGQLDDVLTYRTQYRADIVQMITVPCWYCGIAWVGPGKDWMFSVVTSDCLDPFTSAHEMGHNMGCYHDRAADNQCSSSGYNFGYKNPTQRFTDVMSYDCPDCQCNFNCGTSSCATAARISNTYSLYNGFPIGDANNDCARTINENRRLIASYYDSLPAVPTRPIFSPSKPAKPVSEPVFRIDPGYIVTAMNGKCIDANDRTLGRQLWMNDCHGWDGSGNQIFVRPSSTDLRLQLIHTNLCLDASNSGGAGSQVVLFTCHDGDNQKWIYTAGQQLVPRYNTALCLDLTNSEMNNFAPLVVWDCHGGINQRWISGAVPPNPQRPSPRASKPISIVRKPSSPARAPVTPATKPIASPIRRPAAPIRKPSSPLRKPAAPIRKPSSPLRKPAVPIRMPSPTIKAPTKPVFRSDPGNIFSVMNGKCIDANDRTLGRQLIMYDCHGWDGSGNQIFVRPTSTDLRLQLINTNLCLDASNSGGAGSQVVLYTCNNGDNQKWRYTADQQLVPRYNSALCLDVSNADMNNLAPLIVWDCHGGINQRWSET